MKALTPRGLFASLLALVCIACSTPPSSEQRSPMLAAHDPKNATILPLEERMGLFRNIWTFVSAIDGAELDHSRSEQRAPVSISPGRHRVQLRRNAGKYATTGDFEINARAGQVLQIRSGWAKGFGSPIMIWLEDTTSGKPVTSEGLITNFALGDNPRQTQLRSVDLDDLREKR